MSFSSIYLSSAGDQCPQLNLALKIFLEEKFIRGRQVQILMFADGNPKKSIDEQPIYSCVKKSIESLGYKTADRQDQLNNTYELIDLTKFDVKRMDELLGKLRIPGTVCIVVGGNTWRLSFAFSQLKNLKDQIVGQITRGELMYVSFSAGTIFAGKSVEICRDDWTAVTERPFERVKDGLSICPGLVFRPHNQSKESQRSGAEFQRMLNDGKALNDKGKPITCKIKELKDGQAYLFLGKECLKLPDDEHKIDAAVAKARASSRILQVHQNEYHAMLATDEHQVPIGMEKKTKAPTPNSSRPSQNVNQNEYDAMLATELFRVPPGMEKKPKAPTGVRPSQNVHRR